MAAAALAVSHGVAAIDSPGNSPDSAPIPEVMEKYIAGVVAGGIAVTAGGGVTIVAEGWPQAVLVALAVGAAFGLGSWSADRRIAAIVAVVRLSLIHI